MAKKTRIDRRGKIRSLVRKFPTGDRPHWSITKRAAVNQRRRNIDEVFATDIINTIDEIVFNFAKNLSDGATIEDIVSIGGEKIIINSISFADSGGIIKNYDKPSTADGVAAADAIALGYAKALSESLSLSDTIALNLGVNKSESLSLSEVIGKSYEKPSTADGFSAADVISLGYNKPVTENVTTSDTIIFNIGINKSESLTYSEVIAKDFVMPSLAESASISDSIGFELMNPSGIFNVAKINDFYFNGLGDDQEFFTDSITTSDSVLLSYELNPSDSVTMSDSISFDIRLNFNNDSVTVSDIEVFSSDPYFVETVTMSDAVALNTQIAKSSSASVSDSISFDFMPASLFNASSMNLSQLNG